MIMMVVPAMRSAGVSGSAPATPRALHLLVKHRQGEAATEVLPNATAGGQR